MLLRNIFTALMLTLSINAFAHSDLSDDGPSIPYSYTVRIHYTGKQCPKLSPELQALADFGGETGRLIQLANPYGFGILYKDKSEAYEAAGRTSVCYRLGHVQVAQ